MPPASKASHQPIKSVQESKAERQQRHQARFRDRGGNINGESPTKPRINPRKSKGRASVSKPAPRKSTKPRAPRKSAADRKPKPVKEVVTVDNPVPVKVVQPKKGSKGKGKAITAAVDNANPGAGVEDQDQLSHLPQTPVAAIKSKKSAAARIAEISALPTFLFEDRFSNSMRVAPLLRVVDITIPTPVVKKIMSQPLPALSEGDDDEPHIMLETTHAQPKARNAKGHSRIGDEKVGEKAVENKPAPKKQSSKKTTKVGDSAMLKNEAKAPPSRASAAKQFSADDQNMDMAAGPSQHPSSSARSRSSSIVPPPHQAFSTKPKPPPSPSDATSSSTSTSKRIHGSGSTSTSRTTPQIESDVEPQPQRKNSTHKTFKPKSKSRAPVARGLSTIDEADETKPVALNGEEHGDPPPASDDSIEVPLAEVVKLDAMTTVASEPSRPAENKGLHQKTRVRKARDEEDGEKLQTVPAKKRAKISSRLVTDEEKDEGELRLVRRDGRKNVDKATRAADGPRKMKAIIAEQEADAHDVPATRSKKKRVREDEDDEQETAQKASKKRKNEKSHAENEHGSSRRGKENLPIKTAKQAAKHSSVKPIPSPVKQSRPKSKRAASVKPVKPIRVSKTLPKHVLKRVEANALRSQARADAEVGDDPIDFLS
ncbi:hypothetical protein EW146_g6737 [Bondarzewia mesenterica]|uniref:Uncharacterized protein n=1 Tax=Bondarzewia mesenterica TaxID=1095465 RepID=A0A4S4LPN8_9AGAM|nr:hypothetical protein EW146_g6737 [Bondarzewia mesenterica]